MTAIYGIDMKAKKAMQEAKREAKEDVLRSSQGLSRRTMSYRKPNNAPQDARSLIGGDFTEQISGGDMASLREHSLTQVKTFKTIKRVIWQCSIGWTADNKEIPKELQNVDLKKMRIMMEEIRFLLDSSENGLTRGLNENRILKRFSVILSADFETMIRTLMNEK